MPRSRRRPPLSTEYTIPGSTRTRVAAETLRDWLKRHRRGGFEALLPKPRADRGQSRSLPAEVVDVLLAIKEGNRKLAVQLVIREARKRPEVPDATADPLVMSADGKGIVMRKEGLRESTRKAAERAKRKRRTRLGPGEKKKNRKRMSMVAAIYSMAPHVRSARANGGRARMALT